MAGDFNGDGLPDVAVANKSYNGLTILQNLGGGQFGVGASYALESQPVAMAVGDLNGDGMKLSKRRSGRETLREPPKRFALFRRESSHINQSSDVGVVPGLGDYGATVRMASQRYRTILRIDDPIRSLLHLAFG